MSDSYSQIEYSTREFRALQVTVLVVVFGAVD